jgi:Domain of unknown function (DUF5658)
MQQMNPQHRLSARDIHDIYDRRILSDRRRVPTTFRSTLRWRGRRKRFRRAGEGRNAYVDCPAPRVVLLTLFVLLASIADAGLTLRYPEEGGGEGNPIMALVLTHGALRFLGLKMVLTGLGAWILAAHQQFRLAMRGLCGFALGYSLLLGYHGLIIF